MFVAVFADFNFLLISLTFFECRIVLCTNQLTKVIFLQG